MASSSSYRGRWRCPWCRAVSVTQTSGELLTARDRDLATGSSWTLVRSVLEERLGRTPALEMEDLLWSVSLSLGDGPLWVWLPGVLDVLRISLGSTLIFISSGIGL